MIGGRYLLGLGVGLYLLGLGLLAVHLAHAAPLGPLRCAAAPSYISSPVHCVDTRTGARSTYNPR